jgi:hypothetical protein
LRLSHQRVEDYETVRVRKDGMRIAKYRFNFKFDRQKGDL